MKRVRIMLAAIAVLGTVGGALAFKAKSGNPLYCYKTTQAPVGEFCKALTVGSTIDDGVTNIHYTTTSNRVNCTVTTNCTIPGFATRE